MPEKDISEMDEDMEIDFIAEPYANSQHRVVNTPEGALPYFQPPDKEYQLVLCAKFDIHPLENMLGLLEQSNVPCYSPSKIYVTQGDGHCFYRAISYCIAGTQEHHVRLRKALHDHMKNNIILAEILMSPIEFRQYLVRSGPSNSNNQRQWATDVEIFFMSHLLQTDIAVYKYGGVLTGWHLHKHNYIDHTATAIPSANGKRTAIYINNPNGDHYDVVLFASKEPDYVKPENDKVCFRTSKAAQVEGVRDTSLPGASGLVQEKLDTRTTTTQ